MSEDMQEVYEMSQELIQMFSDPIGTPAVLEIMLALVNAGIDFGNWVNKTGCPRPENGEEASCILAKYVLDRENEDDEFLDRLMTTCEGLIPTANHCKETMIEEWTKEEEGSAE